MELIRLDLGSGPTPVKDTFIGADLCGEVVVQEPVGDTDGEWKIMKATAYHHHGLDIRDSWDQVKPGEVAQVDLRQFPWPWPDNSVAEIFSQHYVCYQTRLEWIQMVNEVHRVLADRAPAHFIWVNPQSGRGNQDPLYLDSIPLERWKYTDKLWREMMSITDPGYPTCDLPIIASNWLGIHDDFHGRSDETKKYATAHYWNASADLSVTLVKRPEGDTAKVVNTEPSRLALVF